MKPIASTSATKKPPDPSQDEVLDAPALSAPSPLVLQLEDFLPYRLSLLSNRISRAIAEHYHTRFKLTLSEWRMMAILGEGLALSAIDLVSRTAMDKVAVSRALKNLELKGYIDRTIASKDKRRLTLSLTDKGSAVYSQIVPAALAYEREILSSLDDREQKTLALLLDKLLIKTETSNL